MHRSKKRLVGPITPLIIKISAIVGVNCSPDNYTFIVLKSAENGFSALSGHYSRGEIKAIQKAPFLLVLIGFKAIHSFMIHKAMLFRLFDVV